MKCYQAPCIKRISATWVPTQYDAFRNATNGVWIYVYSQISLHTKTCI